MTLVKWTTPKVVRRYEWNTVGKPLLLQMVGYFIKWTLLLGLLILWAVGQFAPSELHKTAIPMFGIPLLIAPLIAVLFWWAVLAGVEYQMDSDGLSCPMGKEEHCIHWRQMHSWAIDDHPRIAGIRVLTIKATLLRRLRTRCFSFNPRVTDEARLRALLMAHVRP